MSAVLLEACHLICSCLDWEEVTVDDMSVGGVLPECWPVLDEKCVLEVFSAFAACWKRSNFPLAFRTS
jgi:hypothetical protein